MKYRLLLIMVFGYSVCFSQDVLIKVNGDSINSNIIKISNKNITFKKLSNLEGPEYAVNTDSVYKIVFKNSKEEYFNIKAVERKEIIKSPEEAIEKGNNVFITVKNAVSEKGLEYFIADLNYWGYWNIVQDKSKAHFIMELNINKDKWWFYHMHATLKTVDGAVFIETKDFKKTANAFNGWNAAKALSKELVNDYFKEEFK